MLMVYLAFDFTLFWLFLSWTSTYLLSIYDYIMYYDHEGLFVCIVFFFFNFG